MKHLVLAIGLLIITGCEQPSPKPEAAIPQATERPTPTTGDLSIEAGIVYNVGGPQPVARTVFHLLDTDLESLIRGAGYPETGYGRGNIIQDWDMAMRYHEFINLPEDKARFKALNPTVAAINEHIVVTVKTDFQGKARFEGVPPGRYFLFARTETRGGSAVWNLAVDIRAGQNSIVLDGNNAAVAY